jgi:hypothetical protein
MTFVPNSFAPRHELSRDFQRNVQRVHELIHLD